VLREFYKERNVVIEERRMRTDSNPTAGCWNSSTPLRSRPIPITAPPLDGYPT
jgi:hypothetical protein